LSSEHHPLFTPQDLEAIRQAAESAEKRSSGEVVSYSVERCDGYPEARWKGALYGAVLGAVVSALVHLGIGSWGIGALWAVVPVVVGAALGWAVARIPACARWLVDPASLEQRVRRRAEAAFLEEEVFKTRDRTGVLIFLALFEHRVVVLADVGISAHVKEAEWKGISDALARGIKEGRPGPALVEAIAACGLLLEERRVERREDDTNELPDGLRIRDA